MTEQELNQAVGKAKLLLIKAEEIYITDAIIKGKDVKIITVYPKGEDD